MVGAQHSPDGVHVLLGTGAIASRHELAAFVRYALSTLGHIKLAHVVSSMQSGGGGEFGGWLPMGV